jgi:hypothetical protein
MSEPEPEDEEMAETAEKLDTALDSTADDEASQQSSDSGSATFVADMERGLRDGLVESLGTGDPDLTGSGLGEQFGQLLGEMVVRKLTEQIRQMGSAGGETDAGGLDGDVIETEIDGESLSDALSGDFLSGAKDDIEDTRQVAAETGELLETVDLAELPDAIDVSEVPEAIDFEEVPAAVANADPERAIELKQLASLVEFDDLWDAVDVREFMQEKDELEDAADDLTDDESGADDSSMTDSLDSPSLGSDSSAEGGESFIGQEEAMQAAIQSKLQDAVEEFRESALDARDQLKAASDEAQAQVEAKTGGGTGQPSSRNPTAYSTMVAGWKTGGWSSATFSTVPQGTQHSSAPGHFRIYGQRFENREDDDE